MQRLDYCENAKKARNIFIILAKNQAWNVNEMDKERGEQEIMFICNENIVNSNLQTISEESRQKIFIHQKQIFRNSSLFVQ